MSAQIFYIHRKPGSAATPLTAPRALRRKTLLRLAIMIAVTIFTLLLSTLPAFAITNGAPSMNPRFAAIIKIRPVFIDRNRRNCTGTFISPRHLLTAAHCIDKSPENDFTKKQIDLSTFPSDDLFWKPRAVEVPRVRFFPHPKFDLGIVEFDSAQSNAALKISYAKLPVKTQILLAGYGCDRAKSKWSTPLQTGLVSVVGLSDFVKIKSPTVELCEGDSGAPGLIETPDGLRVVGVASYINKFKGKLGLSKDRLVRMDDPGIQSWIENIVKN